MERAGGLKFEGTALLGDRDVPEECLLPLDIHFLSCKIQKQYETG